MQVAEELCNLFTIENARPHIAPVESRFRWVRQLYFWFQMQDVREEIEEHDLVNHYLNPPSKQSNQVGFVVRDAPWDNVKRSDVKRKEPQTQSKPNTQEKPLPPDTNNIADFPCIGSSAASPRPTAWGPSRRWWHGRHHIPSLNEGMPLRNQDYISVELLKYLFNGFFHFPCKCIVSIVGGFHWNFQFFFAEDFVFFHCDINDCLQGLISYFYSVGFVDEIKLFPHLILSAWFHEPTNNSFKFKKTRVEKKSITKKKNYRNIWYSLYYYSIRKI